MGFAIWTSNRRGSQQYLIQIVASIYLKQKPHSTRTNAQRNVIFFEIDRLHGQMERRLRQKQHVPGEFSRCLWWITAFSRVAIHTNWWLSRNSSHLQLTNREISGLELRNVSVAIACIAESLLAEHSHEVGRFIVCTLSSIPSAKCKYNYVANDTSKENASKIVVGQSSVVHSSDMTHF